MASTPPTYFAMMKAMKHMHIAKSVKDLLGPTGQHVDTWGKVGAFLEKENWNHSINSGQVVEKLREFYHAAEVRKGTIKTQRSTNASIRAPIADPAATRVEEDLISSPLKDKRMELFDSLTPMKTKR